MLSVSNSPSYEPSKDVALSNVGRCAAPLIPKDESACPYVVGHDAHGNIGLLTVAVLYARKLCNLGKDRLHDLCVVYAFLALKDCNGAFNAHSGVYALAVHLHKLTVSGLSILHEDVVPDLEVLAALAAWLAVRTACRTTCIYEHFAVRAARSGLAGWTPPVVLTRQEEDSVVWDSHAVPELCALSVAWNAVFACEYCDGKLLNGDSKHLGEELEAPRNHLFLEVVAKRPVAKHLKASEMMRVPYAVYIACPYAFLVVREPLSRRMLLSQKIRYERMHSSRREKHGWVVLRDDRCTAYLHMAPFNEKVDEFLS